MALVRWNLKKHFKVHLKAPARQQCSLPVAAKSVGCSFKAQSESRSAQTTETVDLLSSSSVFKALPGHRPNVKRLTERHFPSYIPRTEKKQHPTRRCFVCNLERDSNGKRIRKETRTWCRWCQRALCAVPCFEIYHTAGSLQ
ncbi:uncharacterized protein LOC142590629 isoform X1 [Dermacentor variabilis]|uniref:uncharacterized protein LOC142590629 isoform X1 n=1 Tax=Dermacentor variabilis TaxID=34621 RepID=UPI003F5C5979